jgi:hypothetical protein
VSSTLAHPRREPLARETGWPCGSFRPTGRCSSAQSLTPTSPTDWRSTGRNRGSTSPASTGFFAEWGIPRAADIGENGGWAIAPGKNCHRTNAEPGLHGGGVRSESLGAALACLYVTLRTPAGHRHAAALAWGRASAQEGQTPANSCLQPTLSGPSDCAGERQLASRSRPHRSCGHHFAKGMRALRNTGLQVSSHSGATVAAVYDQAGAADNLAQANASWGGRPVSFAGLRNRITRRNGHGSWLSSLRFRRETFFPECPGSVPVAVGSTP